MFLGSVRRASSNLRLVVYHKIHHKPIFLPKPITQSLVFCPVQFVKSKNSLIWALLSLLTLYLQAERSEAETPRDHRSPPDLSVGPNGERTLFQFEAVDIDGNRVPLSNFKGKVVIVVNVATQVNMAPTQFLQLQSLYEKYKDEGLEILAFPCEEFSEEGMESNISIKHVLRDRLGVTFPLFSKIESVNPGENCHPVFYFCRHQLPGPWITGPWLIGWNFTKFLFDFRGHGVTRYGPTVLPFMMEHQIQQLLADRKKEFK
eukprot:TRINITY_DN7908_c0_g1_i7.p1 TRINITY_DN7908_c0_g1~~TRINITY_DN7908_c0_g1_i7.p1  ORF type:complete len:260 (-),score=41.34 TRINITY_DN7908_c0_g1_i7:74-853(-)